MAICTCWLAPAFNSLIKYQARLAIVATGDIHEMMNSINASCYFRTGDVVVGGWWFCPPQVNAKN